MDKIEIRQKKLEYLVGTKFDDEEWKFYNENKLNLNSKAQARWNREWKGAEARLTELEKIDALYTPEPQKIASDLGDILRKWLVSAISDEELCKAFYISEYDRKLLFQEKMASWNSYIGSLVDECDYPLCKIKQTLNGGT
jgi:hypothetical protein